MSIKYAPIKKVKKVINQDVINEVMTTGKKIFRIYYKVINGFLVMVSTDKVINSEIHKTVEIIQQLMKDMKKRSNFTDQFIFTYSIPTLADAV